MSEFKRSLMAKYNRIAAEAQEDNPRKIRYALGYGDFTNYGYWTEDTETGEQACEALMERLMARIPEKRGTILDVACGLGATTRHLLRSYRAEDVTGINLAEAQIDYCRKALPEVRFEVMKAEALAFEDAAFDNVICVEAAFHFETRLDFFREALRVLKPGGRLVLSDILANVPAREQPLENRIASFEQYREVFASAGFEAVETEDATQQAVMRQTAVSWKRLQALRAQGEIREAGFQEVKRSFVSRRNNMTYVLASGVKPG